jgi:hypothetical protein
MNPTKPLHAEYESQCIDRKSCRAADFKVAVAAFFQLAKSMPFISKA